MQIATLDPIVAPIILAILTVGAESALPQDEDGKNEWHEATTKMLLPGIQAVGDECNIEVHFGKLALNSLIRHIKCAESSMLPKDSEEAQGESDSDLHSKDTRYEAYANLKDVPAYSIGGKYITVERLQQLVRYDKALAGPWPKHMGHMPRNGSNVAHLFQSLSLAKTVRKNASCRSSPPTIMPNGSFGKGMASLLDTLLTVPGQVDPDLRNMDQTSIERGDLMRHHVKLTSSAYQKGLQFVIAARAKLSLPQDENGTVPCWPAIKEVYWHQFAASNSRAVIPDMLEDEKMRGGTSLPTPLSAKFRQPAISIFSNLAAGAMLPKKMQDILIDRNLEGTNVLFQSFEAGPSVGALATAKRPGVWASAATQRSVHPPLLSPTAPLIDSGSHEGNARLLASFMSSFTQQPSPSQPPHPRHGLLAQVLDQSSEPAGVHEPSGIVAEAGATLLGGKGAVVADCLASRAPNATSEKQVCVPALQ